MSSWDTNPWSNFSDPHWELICHNKWHPGTSEISTPPEIAVGTQFHARHGTKTIPVFLPADWEASWSLLPSLVSLLLGGTVQPENTYSCCIPVGLGRGFFSILPLRVIRIEQTQVWRMYVASIKVYRPLLTNELTFLIFFHNKNI